MVQVMPSGELFVYPKMIGEWGSAHMKFIWVSYLHLFVFNGCLGSRLMS